MSVPGDDPERAARWYREDCGYGNVDEIDLDDVAQQKGILVQSTELEGVLGLAMVERGQAGICLAEDHRYPRRRRFTYAHELAHLFLTRHYAILAGRDTPFVDEEINHLDPQDALEAEANAFAAELLAPRGRVRARLRTGDLDVSAAIGIGEAFQMSVTASAIRIADASPQDVAVAVFNSGELSWIYESDDFPYGVPRRNWVAPRGTATLDVIAGRGNQTDAVEVSPHLWFPERQFGGYPDRVLESCLKLGRTGAFLTMLWVP